VSASYFNATWNRRFLDLAGQIAQWSKDPDCKVGAVIVTPERRIVSTGYNGFPSGYSDDYLNCDKEKKNAMTIHAELNAILNSTTDLAGTILYVTKDPCLECCKAIVQAGIIQVVLGRPEYGSAWAASQNAGHLLLNEVNVHVVRTF